MQSKFEINSYFNDLPIRIIGSSLDPFFYASDVAKILGIVNIHTSIVNFDDTEIVTQEMRVKHNITTYKKYKNSMRVDNNIVLLTEYGVYRLIINSTLAKAREFKAHVYDLIKNARINETTKLVITPMNDTDTLNQKISLLENELSSYEKYNPVIYCFCKVINDNPYHHMPVDHIFPDFVNVEDLCETLYKFTISPTPDDYTNYKLFAKLHGNTRDILEEILEKTDHHINFKPDLATQMIYSGNTNIIEIDSATIEYIE